MPSTYSTNLKLELIANGEQSGTWGTTTNTNMGTLIEEAICGVGTVSILDVDTTITISNGASSTARKIVLTLTGTLTAARNLIVPSINKTYIVYNNTTGGYAVTVKTSAGTGISVPNGQKRMVYGDSTNINEAIDSFGTANVNDGLFVTNGTDTDTLIIDGNSFSIDHNTTLTTSGATNVTLPTTGTLATIAGTETFTNKTLTSPTINGGTISSAGLTSATLTSSALNAAPSFGDSSLALACTSFIQQALSTLIPTGFIGSYSGTTAPTSWVMMDGTTIGSASSGATGRANADTQTLFTLLWNSFSNTNAPVSGGRGASASADWSANKTIQVPDGKGKVIAGVDVGGTTLSIGTVIGNTGGSQTHTLTASEQASMPVTGSISASIIPGSIVNTSAEGSNFGNSVTSGGNRTLYEATASVTGTISGTATGSGGAHNNVQPTLVMNYIIKL